MTNKRIALLINFLILSIISFGQLVDKNLEGKFIFSSGNNSSTIEFNNNQMYTLTANSCLSRCKQKGKWVASFDTIQLQQPTITLGKDDCLLYYHIYSTLVHKDDKLFIINTDSTNMGKLFYTKAKRDKAREQ